MPPFRRRHRSIQERLLSKIRSSKEIVGSAGYDSCAAGPPPPSEPQANAEDGSSEGGSHRFKIGHFDMSSLLTQYNLLAQ